MSKMEERMKNVATWAGGCWYYYLCSYNGSIQSCDLGIVPFSGKWQRICKNKKDRTAISILINCDSAGRKRTLDLRELQVWGCTINQEDTVWTNFEQKLKFILFFCWEVSLLKGDLQRHLGNSLPVQTCLVKTPNCPITQHANADLRNFLKRAGASVYALFHLYITIALLFGPLPTINTRECLLFFPSQSSCVLIKPAGALKTLVLHKLNYW